MDSSVDAADENATCHEVDSGNHQHEKIQTNDKGDMPARKLSVDELARKVLECSGLQLVDEMINERCRTSVLESNAAGTRSTSCVYLEALERSLDINLLERDITAGQNDKEDESLSASDYWTPPSGNPRASSRLHRKLTKADLSAPSLEEAAPFSGVFYRRVAQLLCQAYNPAVHTDATIKASQGAVLPINIYDRKDLQSYSLFRNHAAGRLTRILLAMMEMNVQHQDRTFLDLLLYYAEGNHSHLFQRNYEHESANISLVDQRVSDNIASVKAVQPDKQRIPILLSIHKYFASLPMLENQVHTLTRQYRAALDGHQASTNNDCLGTTTADKVSRMQKTQFYQERLEGELKKHIDDLEYILGAMYYVCDAKHRAKCRLKIGSTLHSFALGANSNRSTGGGIPGLENASASGIDSLLRITLRIISGVLDDQGQLKRSYHELLFEILVPLHKPSGMVLWRDQTPLIGLYHEPLTQCIGSILRHHQILTGRVILALLRPEIWPTEGGKHRSGGGGTVANTPKVVLLLHELDTYIALLNITPPMKKSTDSTASFDHEKELVFNNSRERIIQSMSEAVAPLTLRLASCISSDNSRASERALQFFKNVHFQVLVRQYLSIVMTPLLKALCRVASGMEIPWNPTVRKMTLIVLRELESYGEAEFRMSCEEMLPTLVRTDTNEANSPRLEAKTSGSVVLSSHSEGPTKDMTLLKNAMGGWRPPAPRGSAQPKIVPSHVAASVPPPSSRSLHGKEYQAIEPPLSVTGVAPWSLGSGSSRLSRKGITRSPIAQTSANEGEPPLTITGVAPWAASSPRGNLPKKLIPGGALGLPIDSAKPIKENTLCSDSSFDGKTTFLTEDAENSDDGNSMKLCATKMGHNVNKTPDSPGLAKVRWFMSQLEPHMSEGESESDGISSWAKAQMAESPVLLPDLKFHDLVFGQTLGTGAFSTVRYARRIDKSKSRSYWAEFAVKIVSTQKIEELRYEKSINREIAILRTLSHQGIARLVSSFRFRDGAYLVLEYASGGDLHTLLKKNGSLDQASTQFVTGEIVAALCSVHEAGLVYGDLKPENILITESGHIKITDFGGCRPLTKDAKRIINTSGKHVLRNLRDGDWREKSQKDASKNNTLNESDVDSDADDERIEGTTAYLPPEVVLGEIPTFTADSWALGCVLYQCLSGKPLHLEDDELRTKQKIVTFELPSAIGDGNKSEKSFFLDSQEASDFSPEAKALIVSLLKRNHHDRPGMFAIAEDIFFDGIDIFSLHTKPAHPLDVGSVAPVADAKWTRRQFSSIWAPQPKAYAVGLDDQTQRKTFGADHSSAPIPEGPEGDACFLQGLTTPALPKINEL